MYLSVVSSHISKPDKDQSCFIFLAHAISHRIDVLSVSVSELLFTSIINLVEVDSCRR